VLTRFGRIRGQRFVRVKVHIALDGKAKRTTEVANLAHADEAEFRGSHAEICEAEGDVVEPELREEPSALRIGREEFDDAFEVDVGLPVVHADDLRLAVGDELFGLYFGQECHVEVPCVGGPKQSFRKKPRTAEVRDGIERPSKLNSGDIQIRKSSGRDSGFGLARPVPV